MKQIVQSRGFWYLQGFYHNEIPPWVTEYEDGSYYFHLNSVTRQYFRKDILPLIARKEVMISPEDYETIRTYKDVELNRSIPSIVVPDGIILKLHQTEAITKMLWCNKFGLFLGTGTGKTIIAISFLLSRHIKTDTLIVTPKTVIDQYKNELNKYIPNHSITVTNYESLKSYSEQKFKCVILDESHKVKNYMSQTSKYLRSIAKNAEYVYLFTGTPQDAKRSEIFPQLSILDEKYMPGKTRFLHRYFTLDDYYNPRTEKKQFSNELDAIIAAVTWGKKTEDVIITQPEHHHVITCDNPGDKYTTLKAKRILRLPSTVVVADNKAVLRSKLRQICSGHVIGENPKTGAPSQETLGTDKLAKLELLITELPNAIIYTEFDKDIELISELLTDNNRSFKCLGGQSKKPDMTIRMFKDGKIDFLVMNCKSGNAGLDLTCTNHMIFYTLPESYIVFSQCKARIQRLGQTKDCNYYYLLCKDSVDEDIYHNALSKKKSYSDKLFNSYSK